MRVLTCLYTLEVGGSQINAIELGAATSRLGHEVIIHGPDGDLRELVNELGLEFIEGPARDQPRLSTAAIRQISRIVRERRIDLVHAYESVPTMDVAYGPHLWSGVPLVVTVLSMSVAKHLPTHLPLIVGATAIAAGERPRRSQVDVIEPPVDTAANSPIADNSAARARFGLAETDCAAVIVSRLVPAMKEEGILAATRAVALIGDRFPGLRLIIVGEGPSRAAIDDAAARTNRTLGRDAVVAVGQLLDPRDAYAAADIVLGMGSSALRAMAFAKPLIVQGELGFWETFSPQTLPLFTEQGWYGLGDGRDGAPRLAELWAELIDDPAGRERLGQFGREVVTDEFSLDAAAARQVEIYHRALGQRPGFLRRANGMAETSARYAWLRAEWLRRLLGRAPGPAAATTTTAAVEVGALR